MKITVLVACFLAWSNGAQAFDHSHAQYAQLLKELVHSSQDNKQTRVSYGRLHQDPSRLNGYLKTLSAVSKEQYQTWTDNQQLSFLINAYNAFTLALINDHYQQFIHKKVNSIIDLGSEQQGPWDQTFFSLFQKKASLNQLEHQMIRVWFARPRIHAALVCAAVSCPPLRDTPFIGSQLDKQLDQQMQLFLSDDTQNTFDQQNQVVKLSSVFKWYKEDFEKGDRGFRQLYDVIRQYKGNIADNAQQVKLLGSKTYAIEFLEYDWSLNDLSDL
jgi:hypothetical protein